MAISVDELANEIMQGLLEYAEETDGKVKDAVDKKTKEVVNALKTHSKIPTKTGKYKKSFKFKTKKEGMGYKTNIIYAGNGQHRLTHLLEYGHLTRNGTSRSKKFPHWVDAEKMAKELHEELVRKL